MATEMKKVEQLIEKEEDIDFIQKLRDAHERVREENQKNFATTTDNFKLADHPIYDPDLERDPERKEVFDIKPEQTSFVLSENIHSIRKMKEQAKTVLESVPGEPNEISSTILKKRITPESSYNKITTKNPKVNNS